MLEPFEALMTVATKQRGKQYACKENAVAELLMVPTKLLLFKLSCLSHTVCHKAAGSVPSKVLLLMLSTCALVLAEVSMMQKTATV